MQYLSGLTGLRVRLNTRVSSTEDWLLLTEPVSDPHMPTLAISERVLYYSEWTITGILLIVLHSLHSG